uniref:DRBM domain-containing protein n=1 Tax=Glossina brevipalpis TaxID=37001 RepID=A0A1A9WPJ1_9MUSC
MKDIDGHGSAPLKRDAKHLAASDVIKKLRIIHADIPEVSQDEQIQDDDDMIAVLRDYCLQNRRPMPTFEIMEEDGGLNAKEFIAVCTLGSIKKTAKCGNKKNALQNAAFVMLTAIQGRNVDISDSDVEMIKLDKQIQKFGDELNRKFKTTGKVTKSTPGEVPGVLLVERHNYFKNLDQCLKAEANNILAADHLSDKEKVDKVLAVLKLIPKVTKMPISNSLESLISVEFNCDYDVYLYVECLQRTYAVNKTSDMVPLKSVYSFRKALIKKGYWGFMKFVDLSYGRRCHV